MLIARKRDIADLALGDALGGRYRPDLLIMLIRARCMKILSLLGERAPPGGLPSACFRTCYARVSTLSTLWACYGHVTALLRGRVTPLSR